MRKLIRWCCLFACCLIICSFKPVSNSESKRTWLIVHFVNYVGNEVLKLDTLAYRNENGQLYAVTKFKYYISNIQLKETSGYEYNLTGSLLLDQDDENSLQVLLKEVPYGNYASVSFLIGVDSAHNCSGAQTGDLDPINGMFWTWNSGYVFLKLEGKSPSSKSTGNVLEYHIGGYQQPANCIRPVTLKFPIGGLTVERSKESFLTLKADVSEILKGPVVIDFSEISSVTDFHNATLMADNYADMFSVLEIK